MALTVPIYQSQQGLTPQGNVSPIPMATGQQEARGLENVGAGMGALAQAAALVQARQEAVARVRGYSDFNGQADALYQNLVTTQDISQPATIQKFGAQLGELQSKILQGNQGSPYSNQMLSARLEEARSRFMDNASAAGVVAGQRLVATHVQQNANQLAAAAYDNPGSVEDQISRLDSTIKEVGPAVTPEQQQQMADQGRAQIIYSGVSSLIDKGAWDTAEKAMATNPDARRVLGDGAYRQLQGRIQQGQFAEYKANNEIASKISQVEQVVGPLSKEQKMAFLGLAPKQGPQTLSGWIADTEHALGRPLTQDEILKHQGIQAADGTPTFGNSVDGIALTAMTELAPAFAHGITSPDQDRRLQAAITQYTQPREVPNPITGVVETHQNQLPAFMVAALQQRGLPVPGQTATPEQQASAMQLGMPGAAPQQVATQAPAAAPVATAQPQGPTGGAVQPASVEGQAQAAIAQSQQSVVNAPSAPSAMGDEPQQTAAPAQAPQPAAPQQTASAPLPTVGGVIQSREPPTLFQMNEQGLVTGPWPAVARALNKEPIGGAQMPGRAETTAKTRIQTAENTLINTLQYSPRFAESERKQIKDEISISPEILGNATNLRQRMIAIDDSLQLRQQSAYETFHNPETSAQEKAQAMNNYNAIVLFRKQLGVPPRVLTPEDARKLPPGTLFINPNGDVKSVPYPPEAQPGG